MTTRVQGATFRYSHTIGRGEEAGTGFKNPVSVARGADDVMYVVSRAYDYRADSKRITICTVGEDYIGEMGNGARLGGELMDTGENAGPGSLVWPTDIALDSEENVYVTDEWLNRIAIFTKDGDWVGAWGVVGQGDGEFDKPSGIVFDAEDNLYLVDTGNNRIQKFTKDGRFLAKWGREGSGDGEFNMPWGIDIDDVGNVYVADWDNDRLQIFDDEGGFITLLTGDATLSKWGETKLDANPEMRLQREIAQGLEREKFFRGPIGVTVDDQDRIFVVDSQRNRIQVYRKIPPYFLGRWDGGRL